MSPDLQKADRAMIDARCNLGGPYAVEYLVEAVDSILEHFIKQEKDTEQPVENAPSTPSFGVWQPIETAPRDESVLVFCDDGEGYIQYSFYSEDLGLWIHMNSGDPLYDLPTHWMPLPPRPLS